MKVDYEKRIKIDTFENINIAIFEKSKIVGLNIDSIHGSATTALEIEDAKRLRNYLTEAINFATLNKKEER